MTSLLPLTFLTSMQMKPSILDQKKMRDREAQGSQNPVLGVNLEKQQQQLQGMALGFQPRHLTMAYHRQTSQQSVSLSRTLCVLSSLSPCLEVQEGRGPGLGVQLRKGPWDHI